MAAILARAHRAAGALWSRQAFFDRASRAVKDRAERIDALFTLMSGDANADRWTDRALSVDPGWREIRTLAREALDLLRNAATPVRLIP